jgi:hypothetical protein
MPFVYVHNGGRAVVARTAKACSTTVKSTKTSCSSTTAWFVGLWKSVKALPIRAIDASLKFHLRFCSEQLRAELTMHTSKDFGVALTMGLNKKMDNMNTGLDKKIDNMTVNIFEGLRFTLTLIDADGLRNKIDTEVRRMSQVNDELRAEIRKAEGEAYYLKKKLQNMTEANAALTSQVAALNASVSRAECRASVTKAAYQKYHCDTHPAGKAQFDKRSLEADQFIEECVRRLSE